MTNRQEKFCLEYVKCGNATEAYKAAGYNVKNDKTARVNASRMLSNASVRALINELSEEAKSEKILNATQRREILTQIAMDDESSKQDKIKAIDTLNKMDGAYLQRTEITGGVPVVICDDITDDAKRQEA